MTCQLVETPDSVPGGTQYQHLAYMDANDAVLNCDYAFVAYKETDSYGWRVRIKSSQTAGGVFEPDAMLSNARSTGAQGKPWFQWGYSFDPGASDPRCIQFRVHVVNGQPSEFEIFVQLRKFDGAADAPKSVKFSWPDCWMGTLSLTKHSSLPICGARGEFMDHQQEGQRWAREMSVNSGQVGFDISIGSSLEVRGNK